MRPAFGLLQVCACMRVLDHQSPRVITSHRRPWLHSAIPTKRGLALCTLHNHGRPWILCMTAGLDVTPKTTDQNRIVRTSKSEAEVSNNKKKTALEVSYYWSNEANYWQTRSIARPLCYRRTTCSVSHLVTPKAMPPQGGGFVSGCTKCKPSCKLSCRSVSPSPRYL